ncbi:MAG TPA: cupin domain-containing protein [Cyclobacteriaceae bacterium]|nr:cupin domain-containing protein [Cyclobacteriaceae bacterium]
MTIINLNNLELNEFIGKYRVEQHCKATFPMFRINGTKSSATVYLEIEPGDNLGMHTDSAEELLLILEGEADLIIGGEKMKAAEKTLAHVPVLVPHDIINSGSKKLKVLGFFGGANDIVATFENVWLPTDSKVVDTSQVT